MELKIISDGTSEGTKVVNSETEEEINGVTSIEWSIGSGEFAVAKIEFNLAQAEVVVSKPKIVKPKKKELDLKKEFDLLPPDVDDVPF